MEPNPYLHLKAPKLGVMPGEDEELVNEGTYGQALCLYLEKKLTEAGYEIPFVNCEDWGWWVEIRGMPFLCGVGVYGRRLGETDELDLYAMVIPDRGKRWSWKKFWFVDTTPVVSKLHGDLVRIFSEDPDITLLGETLEFPFGEEDHEPEDRAD